MKVRLPLSLLFACSLSGAAGVLSLAADATTTATVATTTPTASTVYSDPLISKQWQWNPNKGGVNIAPLWADGITGTGVVIGIIDSWVEPNHEDLNVSPYNPGTNLSNGLSKDFVGTETIPADDPETEEDESKTQIYTSDSHGTFVAGMAAAIGGNGVGLVGAAPGATIAGLHAGTGTIINDALALNAMWWGSGVSSSGGYSGEAAIQVKNCSFGSSWVQASVADQWSAIETTSRNNVIYVFAAGNSRGGDDATTPGSTGWSSVGSSPYIINVAATNSDGTYTSFSSYGSNVFISAPGAAVVSTDRTGSYGYNSGGSSSSDSSDDSTETTISNANYASDKGTSFAAPIVSGVIALGKQICPAMDVRWAKHALAYSSGNGKSPNIDYVWDAAAGTYVQESGYTTTETDDDGNTTTTTVASTGNWQQNNGGYWFNNNYGFGLIDPEGFVDTVKAIAYTTVETKEKKTGTAQGANGSVSYTIDTKSSENDATTSILTQSIETVSVKLNFSSDFLANEDIDLDSLTVTLVSPDGLESVLVQPSWDTSAPASTIAASEEAESASWTFLTNAFWGANYSNVSGDKSIWEVKITDEKGIFESDWVESVSVDFTMGEMVFESATSGVRAGTTVNAHALALDTSGFTVNGNFYVEDGVYVRGGTFVVGVAGEVDAYAGAALKKGAIYVQTGGSATIEGNASFSRGVYLYGGTFNLKTNGLSAGTGFFVDGGALNVTSNEIGAVSAGSSVVTVYSGSVSLDERVNFQTGVVLYGGTFVAKEAASGTTLALYGNASTRATLAKNVSFSSGISVGKTETISTTDEETGMTTTETVLYGGTLSISGVVTTPMLALAGNGSAYLSRAASSDTGAKIAGSVSVSDSAYLSLDGSGRNGVNITGGLDQDGGRVVWTGKLTTSGGVYVSGGTLYGGSTLAVSASADAELRNVALSVSSGGTFHAQGTTTVESGEVVLGNGATLAFSSRSKTDYDLLVIGGGKTTTEEITQTAGLTFSGTGSGGVATVNVAYDFGDAVPYEATLIKLDRKLLVDGDGNAVKDDGGNEIWVGDVAAVTGAENAVFSVSVANAPKVLKLTDAGAAEKVAMTFGVTKTGNTFVLESDTDFENRWLVYDGQSEMASAVQISLLKNEAASERLLSYVDSLDRISDIYSVYETVGTPINVIAIDELHDKQANALTNALSRRSRELRSGFIHSDIWSNPLFGQSGFSFSARPNQVAATGFVPFLAAEEDYPLMVWLNGSYSLSETDSDVISLSSTKSNMISVAAGFDYAVSDNLALGLFAGYTNGRTKFDNGSRTDIQSRNLGVYLAGSRTGGPGSLYYTAMAAWGYEEYDFKRKLSAGDFSASAKASPDGWQGIAFLEGGYEWKMGKVSMGPVLSLRYVSNNLDSYTESSGDAWMRQDVDDVSYDSLQSSVGWRIAGRVDLETVSLLPEARISWNHEFLGRDEDFDSRLALTGASPYTSFVVNTGDDYATFGVGLTAMLGEVSTLSLDYDVQFLREDADPTHTFSVMLRVRF